MSWFVLALSVGRIHTLPIPTIEPRAPSCDNLHNCRTMWNLIWSCMATILLCIWVAVHPNIPGADDKWTQVISQRVRIALIALVAPELIILWAVRQWLNAHELARKYRKYGWTRTHGFFAIMGGFVYYKDDKPPVILDPTELAPYLQTGEIDITQKEIRDKSRADVLSKGLVVVQTGWFILQCIARCVEHFPITEIELVTLAFATLNFVSYGLWWDKPLGVQCPYRVGKGKPIFQSEVEVKGEYKGEQGGYNGTVFSRSKNLWTTAHGVPIAFIRKTMAAFQAIVACVREKRIWSTAGHVAWVMYENSLGKIGYMGLRKSDDIAPGAKSVPMFYSGKLIRHNIASCYSCLIGHRYTLWGDPLHCVVL